MSKYIIVKADTNDADYVYNIAKITDEQIKSIQPMIEAIKNCEYCSNYETNELVNDTPGAKEIYKDVEGFDFFNNNYVPYGDPNYPGIHTIESIEIFEKLEKLL